MKKNIMLFGIAFVIGLIIYQLMPVKTAYVLDATLAYKSKSDVIKESDIIVRVTVNDILPSKWSNPNFQRGDEIPNLMQTDISLTIDEVYKGVPYNYKNIIVIVPIGVIGNETSTSDSVPDFKIGDNYILFLSKESIKLKISEGDYYILTGATQGAYILDKSSTDPEYVICTLYRNERIILSDFKNEIVSAIKS